MTEDNTQAPTDTADLSESPTVNYVLEDGSGYLLIEGGYLLLEDGS